MSRLQIILRASFALVLCNGTRSNFAGFNRPLHRVAGPRLLDPHRAEVNWQVPAARLAPDEIHHAADQERYIRGLGTLLL